ncbi:MAG TPA: serine/threonine-protein kinase [Burkholderiales bacterium]|nr:serine/threonine-protein kinase [Burkholderiales bacterium]
MEKIGKYEIVKEIAKGATSSVFLANDPFAGRQVAIKLVNSEALRDKQKGRRYKKLFLTEASLVGKLSHPHIVTIYDAVAEDQLCYIVMEYVPGGTLEQYCKVENLLPIDRVIEIIFKCSKALAFAHRHGIIHRDIKPANIMFSDGLDIKISDFGAALTEQTDTTQIIGVGSPAYMSPQQVKEQPLTHQTDIYSLGVVMYQLLTGRLPFTGNNNYSIIYQIINVDPPPPSLYRPEIPPQLDVIVKTALRKDLETRYQSWEEFAQKLIEAFNNLEKPKEDFSEGERFDVLRKLSFFNHFSDVELWEVMRITRWRKFPPGTTLIKEGGIGKGFFILVAGEVNVTKEGKLLNVLQPGECFGEMAYLGRIQFTRTASIISVSEVTAIEITAESLAQASDNCRHQFNRAFLEILVDRLSAANVRLSQLLLDRKISIF